MRERGVNNSPYFLYHKIATSDAIIKYYLCLERGGLDTNNIFGIVEIFLCVLLKVLRKDFFSILS